MSMVQRSRSGQFLSALRTCVMQLHSCPLSEWGSNKLVICGVSLNGINSGIGRNCVEERGIACLVFAMTPSSVWWLDKSLATVQDGWLSSNLWRCIKLCLLMEAGRTSRVIIMHYLCSSSKGMAKVNPHSPTTLQVHHEVWQVSISNAEHVVTQAESGVGPHKVGTEGQKCFRRWRELEECTAVETQRFAKSHDTTIHTCIHITTQLTAVYPKV